MYALKATFHKQGDMIYFSQLDIFRLFMRALRRGRFPIIYTGGFNPRPKMSFGNALKLGIEGDFEAVFYFEREFDPAQFKDEFSNQIPEDMTIVNVEKKR